MKLHEIDCMGMELVFLKKICPITGMMSNPTRQPKDWDNVKRLTNMLFLAWDDRNTIEGSVYLGELVTPPQPQKIEKPKGEDSPNTDLIEGLRAVWLILDKTDNSDEADDWQNKWAPLLFPPPNEKF